MFAENHVVMDLYSALEANPSSIDVHERLLDAWLDLQALDMAEGVAAQLIVLDTNNARANSFLKAHQPPTSPASNRQPPSQWKRPTDHASASSTGAGELTLSEKEVSVGYKALMLEATMLAEEVGGVACSDEHGDMVNNLELIAEGRVNSAVSTAEPRSAREAARDIVANRNRNEVLLCEDFEMVAQWMKSRNPPADGDAIRARLVKRRTLLQAALPTSLSGAVSKAFATVERECLQKQYANSTTMTTLEPIASIPRDAFFVSEDNYAWDMEELVQALACNGGVMRNPLSRDLFSNADIEAILDHPMGRQLRPMQEAQHRMQHGFRPSTVAWISKLGSILLNEQSSDAASSRAAIDEFLAYMATLPAAERQAVDALKIAASDGHTGQAYDYTVGDSVRDAKMNTTCFHKVGDFLAQAASYLGRR